MICANWIRWARIGTRAATVIAVCAFGLWGCGTTTLFEGIGKKNSFGRIIVESPGIYSRERLVNDRLQQSIWLKTQLGATEKLLTNEKFRSLEAELAQRVLKETTLRVSPARVPGSTVNGSPAEDENANPGVLGNGGAGNPETNADLVLGETTIGLFRALNQYREELRSELMQIQLDDRHDIDGNTLYRLNFNTSIIHGRSSDAHAIIRVELRQGDRSDAIVAPVYEELLRDWIRVLERRLNGVVENNVYLLAESGLNERDAAQLYVWLRWKVCRQLTDIANSEIYKRIIADTNTKQGNERSNIGEETWLPRPETIEAVSVFASSECGDEYYSQLSEQRNEELYSGTIAERLDWFISDYVNRFTRARTARARIGNYISVRSKIIENHKDGRQRGGSNGIRYGDDPLEHFLYLERKWCGRPVVEGQGGSDGDHNRQGGNGGYNFGGNMERVSSVLEVRERRLVAEHCSYMVADRNRMHAIPAIMDLLWRLERLDRALTYEGFELAFDRIADKWNNGSGWGRIRFDQIDCDSSAVKNVERLLGSDVELELREARRLFDSSKGLFCNLVEPPWLWQRNLVVAQQIAQFNREFVDDGDVWGTGILQGIISVEEVGCHSAICRVSVKLGHADGGELVERKRVRDAVNCFFDRLDENYETFSYGITPKNLHMRWGFEGVSDWNTGVSVILPDFLTTAVDGSFGLVRERKEAIRTVVRDPIVVGFGRGTTGRSQAGRQLVHRVRDSRSCGGSEIVDASGKEMMVERDGTDGNSSREFSRGAEFGWIIAPERRFGPERGKWHPHRRYDLAAVVSVPSWWRRATLTVSSCWRKWDDLDKFGNGYIDACGSDGDGVKQKGPGWSDNYMYSIKLPGDISEVSRKLRLDNHNGPYIRNGVDPDVGTYVFQVGQPARIVIEGARLWRSSHVTLGTQSSDVIQVLPHMEGIIATFDCVRPPPYLPVPVEVIPPVIRKELEVKRKVGKNMNIYFAKTRVWTSEGVTDIGIPVTIVDRRGEGAEVCMKVGDRGVLAPQDDPAGNSD